jgi:anti-sigma regulatory factor (Ser/Thr protein kinase)
MTSATGYQHAALLYSSTEELVATAVPFLSAGLAAGEAAVLSCEREHNALLAEALGDDRVVLMHRENIYLRPGQAIATYRRMVRRQVAVGAARVRLVGEVPVDGHPQQWTQWHRYEAICNVALAPLPLSSACAYDTRRLPEPIHATIESHPSLLTSDGHLLNRHYVEPATVLRRTAQTRPDPLERTPPALSMAGLTDITALPPLRARIRAALGGPNWQKQPRYCFAAAVEEVLINAFQHGRPPVDVRVWTASTQLACTVTDCGQGFEDPLAGYHPPDRGPRRTGAGLWLVRQTCDTLEAYRTPTGFAVHVAAILPAAETTPSTTAGAAAAEALNMRTARARVRARELARRLDGRS